MLKQVGFHQDKYLLDLVDILVKIGNITTFIETGSHIGGTLDYFSTKYPSIRCFSCEPGIERYLPAKEKTKNKQNVNLFNTTSQLFLQNIKSHFSHLFKEPTLFWLDAHSYGFEWPLREEIDFITSHFSNCYILIDDFVVPGKPNFGFDSYNGQHCSHEYIKNNINWSIDQYDLYYPAYTERTSPYHPLRGWGLYVYNLPKLKAKTTFDDGLKIAYEWMINNE